MLKGNGKFTPNGIGSKKDVNEAVKIAYQYFKSMQVQLVDRFHTKIKIM